MKQIKLIMGMPIIVEIADDSLAAKRTVCRIFDYFNRVDEKFSTYKSTSEITKINSGELKVPDVSADMRRVLALCEKTKKLTNGYFDITKDGKLDPSGLVKGWAILNASKLLRKEGFLNFYINAGGDIQVSGKSSQRKIWSIGIRNPFNVNQIIKVVYLNDVGLATSGTYERGQHIYNPKDPKVKLTDTISLTVIGPNVYEADRFATAAFAMGKEGINFIEKLESFEGYAIDKNGIAMYTTGFEKYTNV
jgi:FAD:protein FMN transferase